MPSSAGASGIRLILGDCVERMRELPDSSVDAVVTDPPYGLEFMGKDWDSFGRSSPPSFKHSMQGGFKGFKPLPRPGGLAPEGMRRFQTWSGEWAREAFRVLKPGGHLLAFGGTRTYHRLACAVEDAGFEIRDQLLWLYGSGFPKSLDVSKAIDKDARGVPQGGADPTSPNHGRYKTQATEGKRGDGDTGRGYGAGPGQFMRDTDGRGALIGNTGLHVGDVDPHTGRVIRGIKPGHEDFVDRKDAHAAGGRSDGWDRPWREDEANVLSSHLLLATETEEAEAWQGWGTALKPACEPIVFARKPLAGTVAGNVLEHGTGALNIDACRIGFRDEADERESKEKNRHADFGSGARENQVYGADERARGEHGNYDPPGRWPANVILGHHPECEPVGVRRVRGDGHRPSARPSNTGTSGPQGHGGQEGLEESHADEFVEAWVCHSDCPVRMLDEQTGDLGASRFFYVAKASRTERNAGLGGFEESVDARTPMAGRGQGGLKCRVCGKWKASGSPCRCPEPDFEQVPFDRPPAANQHPTVKPIELMRWLVRLVTPPGGVVLDPFLGSGTTGIAAQLEGFAFIGIEREPDYLKIAEARLKWWSERVDRYGDRSGLVPEADVRAESGQASIFDMLEGV